ncbi:MAG: M20/M25/M40 family metallo-hydrolase [Acidobacteria bacterium]|nr:M20/M25/M40 family metallo-hydrolase [Acidobacteriota bacterium]
MPKYTPFESAHRRTARRSLYSSALLSGLLVFALTRSYSQLGSLEEASRSREYWESVAEVRLLQRYIAIDTSEREIEGARFLAEQLRAAGLDPVLEELGDGRANLWAILEGEQPEALVLHNHIDVFRVAQPDKWDFPPFEGLIDPPFLYGRGAFDMKSLAIAQLEAIRALAASPSKPLRSVIFLATADEERGSRLGVRWILREHPELAQRFRVVLTEGGVVEPLRVSEVKYWGIETAQKRFVEGEACAMSREPLEWLHDQLARRRREFSVPIVTPEVADFLHFYSPTRQDDFLRSTLDAVLAQRVDPLHFRASPRYLRSLFLNELVAFPVEKSAAGGFRMRLALHLLPGAEMAAVLEEKLPAWLAHDVSISFGQPLGAMRGSSRTTPTFERLVEILDERHPGTPIGPHFLPRTATDARFFRAAGIPTYGFSPFLFFSTESFRADTINERINLPGYVAGVDTYVEAVRRLAQEP